MAIKIGKVYLDTENTNVDEVSFNFIIMKNVEKLGESYTFKAEVLTTIYDQSINEIVAVSTYKTGGRLFDSNELELAEDFRDVKKRVIKDIFAASEPPAFNTINSLGW